MNTKENCCEAVSGARIDPHCCYTNDIENRVPLTLDFFFFLLLLFSFLGPNDLRSGICSLPRSRFTRPKWSVVSYPLLYILLVYVQDLSFCSVAVTLLNTPICRLLYIYIYIWKSDRYIREKVSIYLQAQDVFFVVVCFRTAYILFCDLCSRSKLTQIQNSYVCLLNPYTILHQKFV